MTNNKPPVRALAYVRQSSAKAGENASDALSLEAQEDAIQRYCAERGITLVRTVRDHDLSGEDWDRPGIKELLNAAAMGDVDTVVVFKLSRFARDVLYQELTHRELKKRGVSLQSVTEAGIEKPLIRMVYGGMAQQHNEDHRDWLKNTLRSRANRGLHHGRAPYGYVVPSGTDRTNRRLDIHPDEAPVVKRIFEMRASGLGPIAIANRLNADGIRSKSGGPWWSSSIRELLKVGTFAGYAVYQGEIVGDLDPTNTPPIIDRVLWHQVQHMWAGGRAPKAHEERKSWVQGLVYHECGVRMWYVHTKTANARGFHGKPAFVCGTHARSRDTRCTVRPKEVRVHPVEHATVQCILQDLAAIPASLSGAIDRYLVEIGTPDALKQLAELERRRDHLRASIKRAEQMVVKGFRDEVWFAEQDAELQVELRDVLRAIERAQDTPDPSALAPLHHSLLTMQAAFPLMSDDKRFELLTGLGRVVVGATVRIQYLEMFAPFFPNPTQIRYIYHRGKNVYSYETV
jgi:DNA invertase Pin-like site-specific DNA recombinase